MCTMPLGVEPVIRASFGMGTGMIVEQIRCSGTERRLAYCTTRDVTDRECDHSEDAGVICCKYKCLSITCMSKLMNLCP